MNMPSTKVILLSCGSYNPPTNMHLRMFEIARDHLHKMGSHVVIGGVISPVHDAYGKKDLASASHRIAMLKLALRNTDWIRLSTWETRRENWTKTRQTLQYHQNLLNSLIFDNNDSKHYSDIEDMDWIPENIKNIADQTPIQVKLLCGADLLESFGTPGLWAEEDIDAIVGQHGLIVITRNGSNPNKFIYDSDLLTKYMHNICIVTEWISNEISSTKIRRALRRGESVKYLIQDPILDYIYQHELYKATRLPATVGNNYLNINTSYSHAFLTPSPSDVTMESPSPVEIISRDVPDTVLKRNSRNIPPDFMNFKLEKSVDDRLHTDNGNKIAKSIYPGQAKQIIATETGESHVFDEVGSSSIDDATRQMTKPAYDEQVSLSNKSSDFDRDKPIVDHSEPVKNPPATLTIVQDSEANRDATSVSDETVVTTTITYLSTFQADESCLSSDRIVEECENLSEDTAKTIENNFLTNTSNTAVPANAKNGLVIDGKYLKSLVNSRKSPSQAKSKMEKQETNDCDEQISGADEDAPQVRMEPQKIIDQKIFGSNSNRRKFDLDEKLKLYKICDGESLESSARKIAAMEFAKSFGARRPFVPRENSNPMKFGPSKEKSAGFDSVSKKSKSYESVKFDGSKSLSYKSFEISYNDCMKVKSESTSKLITSDLRRMENFCAECCIDDPLVTEVSLNQETFYTGRSGQSSPIEDSVCDVCSACNLDSSELLDKSESNVCEICNELELAEPEESPTKNESDRIEEDDGSSEKFEIENCGLETSPKNCDGETIMTENDRFEIENCGKFDGLQQRSAIKGDEERSAVHLSNDNIAYAKYVLSRDSSSTKLTRKGSFFLSSSKLRPENRRFSSVDNLQRSREFLKKIQTNLDDARNIKLVASADCITSSNAKRLELKKFQKSANDIDSLKKLSEESSDDSSTKLKSRDNDMVKMILTKHGIKIISEKETAL